MYIFHHHHWITIASYHIRLMVCCSEWCYSVSLLKKMKRCHNFLVFYLAWLSDFHVFLAAKLSKFCRMLTDYLNINTHAFNISLRKFFFLFFFFSSHFISFHFANTLLLTIVVVFNHSKLEWFFPFIVQKLLSVPPSPTPPPTLHTSCVFLYISSHLFHICSLHFANTCETAGNKCKSREECYTVAHRLKRENPMVLSMCPKNVLLC